MSLPYDSVICFSCGDWWYHNRGHFDMQIMRRFARNVPILYVNAMGMRLPSITEGSMFVNRILRKLRSFQQGLRQESKTFYVFSPVSVPLYSRPLLRKLNTVSVTFQIKRVLKKLGMRAPLIWTVSPPAIDVIGHIDAAGIIYQRTDDFKQFASVCRAVIGGMDDETATAADLIIHVNRQLHERSLAQGHNSVLVSHGVDSDLFSPDVAAVPEPPDIAGIAHPRIGFHGGIDIHTLDPDLLLKVAMLLPECSFVLVGACSIESLRAARLPNIHLLGQKPYKDIPSYSRTFDVCIMPWQQNDWIAGCNPIKLKEYLALGKPVVSTPYPEGEAYRDMVRFAGDPEVFAEAIRSELGNDSASSAAQRRQRVAADTWDALAAHLLQVIDRALAPTPHGTEELGHVCKSQPVRTG